MRKDDKQHVRIVKVEGKRGANGCGPRCAYYREIERLREVCLNCRVCNDGNSMQCGGRGVISTDSTEDEESVIAHSIGRKCNWPEVYRNRKADSAPRRVSKLPEAVEERVRLLLAGLIGLRPIQVLVLHHLANGGNLSNFQEYVNDLIAQWDRNEVKDKRMTWALFQPIRKHHPELDVLFERHNRGANHPGKNKGGVR